MLLLAAALATLTVVVLLNHRPVVVGGREGGTDAVMVGLPPFVRAVLLSERLFLAGLPALAYVLAGIGLGRLWRPLVRGSSEVLAMQAALGTATLLWLSPLLGWL